MRDDGTNSSDRKQNNAMQQEKNRDQVMRVVIKGPLLEEICECMYTLTVHPRKEELFLYATSHDHREQSTSSWDVKRKKHMHYVHLRPRTLRRTGLRCR